MSLPEHDPYPHHRANIGLVLFNRSGRVWLGRRASQIVKSAAEQPTEHWQFPQGGLDAGETPEQGGLRELYEETGLTPDKVAFLARTPDWLAYDFPPEVRASKPDRSWMGQKQLWFAYRFLGRDEDFNLNLETPPEFDAFKWGTFADAIDSIIFWKRPVYQQVAEAFAEYEI